MGAWVSTNDHLSAVNTDEESEEDPPVVQEDTETSHTRSIMLNISRIWATIADSEVQDAASWEQVARQMYHEYRLLAEGYGYDRALYVRLEVEVQRLEAENRRLSNELRDETERADLMARTVMMNRIGVTDNTWSPVLARALLGRNE